MKPKEMLSAFACGAAVMVMMRVLIVDVGAQAEKDKPLIVCANTEGRMRVIDPEGACSAGEKKIPLRMPKVQLPCEKAREADIGALQRRIAELEGRADERILDRTAMAPFEVVNEAGIVVFSVNGPSPGTQVGGTEIFNETGGRVAVIAANSEGGSISVESGVTRPFTQQVDGPAVSANLHSFGDYADLSLTVVANKKLELGRRANGRYGLRMFGAPETVVAGIGESEGGSGLALVADTNGNTRAALSVIIESGSGAARIVDAAGKEVASLSAAGFGGSGLLQLRNNADTVMVDAGVLDTGIGVVRAGPGAFQHGLMFLGLPASWIEGRK
jgi:hypothetical protein